MAGASRGKPVARLVAAVARRVEQTSLRQAAREVGMSPAGLRKVLAGSRLHPSTERKLASWHVRHLAEHGGEGAVDPDTAAAAISLLTDGMPDPQRKRIAEGIAAMVEEGYRGLGLPAPGWVAALRDGGPPDEAR